MTIFVSQLLPEKCVFSLRKHGFSPCFLAPFDVLPRPVCTHADMLIFDDGGRLLLHGDYYRKNIAVFSGWDCVLTEEKISDTYPHDILFNALKAGEKVYGLKKYLSKYIVEKHDVVNIKQGYARCSVCRAGGPSYITADASLALALQKDGFDVLQISAGNITLPGYEYGFIGGASFYYNSSVYFFGDISRHPDFKRIAAFAGKTGTRLVTLSDEPLFDAGGAVLRE